MTQWVCPTLKYAMIPTQTKEMHVPMVDDEPCYCDTEESSCGTTTMDEWEDAQHERMALQAELLQQK